jgi:hypothetical protein
MSPYIFTRCAVGARRDDELVDVDVDVAVIVVDDVAVPSSSAKDAADNDKLTATADERSATLRRSPTPLRRSE